MASPASLPRVSSLKSTTLVSRPTCLASAAQALQSAALLRCRTTLPSYLRTMFGKAWAAFLNVWPSKLLAVQLNSPAHEHASPCCPNCWCRVRTLRVCSLCRHRVLSTCGRFLKRLFGIWDVRWGKKLKASHRNGRVRILAASERPRAGVCVCVCGVFRCWCGGWVLL